MAEVSAASQNRQQLAQLIGYSTERCISANVARYDEAGIVRTSPKAIVPVACCFAAFGYIGWQIAHAGGDFRLDRGYKVEIVVHGPDGKIIPAIGQAPK